MRTHPELGYSHQRGKASSKKSLRMIVLNVIQEADNHQQSENLILLFGVMNMNMWVKK